MKTAALLFKEHWDRLSIYILLMAFGAYSTVYPLVSIRRATPHWSSILLGIEFFAAGFLLVLGMVWPRYRMVGLLVVSLGLATISVVTASYGGTRLLAYTFLFGAFAMQSIHDIRRERRERLNRREAQRRLAEELVKLVEESDPGSRP